MISLNVHVHQLASQVSIPQMLVVPPTSIVPDSKNENDSLVYLHLLVYECIKALERQVSYPSEDFEGL